MSRIFRTVLCLTLSLCACSPGSLSPEALSTTDIIPASTTEVSPSPKLIATLSTPHIDQGPDGVSTVPPSTQGCAYQWAYEDLPELSDGFLRSIQELQPDAQANAFAFGENCIHADGTATFIAMETDFNITLQVADLGNESDLGEWVVKVMQVILNIPQDQIVGPRPGRVSMIFQSNGEQKVVNFYIDQYQALPAGLSSAEIYQSLQIPQ